MSLLTNRSLHSIRSCSRLLLSINAPTAVTIDRRQHLGIASAIVERFPLPSWRPYLRLIRADKPTGTLVILWPGLWGVAIAAEQLPNSLYLLALFTSGAFLMRSAGCIVNDMWDRRLDARVQRTKTRPLASGQLTLGDAVALLAVNQSLALLLLLQLNNYTIALGFACLPLVAVYPIMKRFTNWPQVVLGFTINWGALMGYSAVHGSIACPIVLPLYLACVSWTMLYDTIYAHQDKRDDLLAGVKSTALLFGERTKRWLAAFAASWWLNLTLAGYSAGLAWPYHVAVALSTLQIGWQVKTLDIDDPSDCWRKFRSNQQIGPLIFTGICLGKLCMP